MEEKKSSFSTVSLVLGAIALGISIIPIVNNFSFVLGVIGFIFAVVALMEKETKSGRAVAAISLCILAIAIAFSMQLILTATLNEVYNETYNEIYNQAEEIQRSDIDVMY